jgi:hypothetical protein
MDFMLGSILTEKGWISSQDQNLESTDGFYVRINNYNWKERMDFLPGSIGTWRDWFDFLFRFHYLARKDRFLPGSINVEKGCTVFYALINTYKGYVVIMTDIGGQCDRSPSIVCDAITCIPQPGLCPVGQQLQLL